MRLVPIERCADCIWYHGEYYGAIGHIPEEYKGKCKKCQNGHVPGCSFI